MSFIAGRYDQSHAHQEQGAFSLYRGRWLAVTENIWTHSGIQQGSETNNVLRFTRAGHNIGQVRPSESTLAIDATPTDGQHPRQRQSQSRLRKRLGRAHLAARHRFRRRNVARARSLRRRSRRGGRIPDQRSGRNRSSTATMCGPAISMSSCRHPPKRRSAGVDWTAQDADFLSGWRIDIEGSGGAFDVRLSAADAPPKRAREEKN